MKKTIAAFLVVLMALCATAPVASAAAKKATVSRTSGGAIGFVIGCCIGPRSAAAYNDGKALHWTEWGRFIPYVGWVIGIINGIDAFNGMDSKDMVETYGSVYY
jgi:hypothetical protein